MISLMGVAVASGLAKCITPRAAFAADGPKKVNAQGPAQALDMIIIMKVALLISALKWLRISVGPAPFDQLGSKARRF